MQDILQRRIGAGRAGSFFCILSPVPGCSECVSHRPPVESMAKNGTGQDGVRIFMEGAGLQTLVSSRWACYR